MREKSRESKGGRRLLHLDLTDKILGSFYQVYRELGGGFVEAIYEHALVEELEGFGLRAARQVARFADPGWLIDSLTLA